MLEQVKQIAERLKGIRDAEEISIQEMAKKCDVPVDVYESYESGEVDIPIGFLYVVANIFDIELTELLSGDAPKLRIYQLVRKGEGLDVERRKQYKYESLAFNFRHKKAEIFTVEVPQTPKDAAIELNTHTGHEFSYVLEGSMKLILNGKELTLNAGDSIYFDASYAHGMQAADGKAKFLAVIFK